MVIASMLRLLGHDIAAFFDDDLEKQGTELVGVRVRTPCSELHTALPLPSVVGIGCNRIRQEFAQHFNLEWATLLHSSAIVDQSVTIGPGSVVMAGAIIQAGARIGEHCIINTGATVDHDCHIADFCHIGPGVNIAGHCMLEQGVFVGIGACLVPSVHVGEWTMIGAGAAVVGDLPANVTATGVPARPRHDRRSAD